MLGDIIYSKLDSWTANTDMELKDMPIGAKPWDKDANSPLNVQENINNFFLSHSQLEDNVLQNSRVGSFSDSKYFENHNQQFSHTVPKLENANNYLNHSLSHNDFNIPKTFYSSHTSFQNNYNNNLAQSMANVENGIDDIPIFTTSNDPFLPVSTICDETMLFDLELDFPSSSTSHCLNPLNELSGHNSKTSYYADHETVMLQLLDDFADLHPEFVSLSEDNNIFSINGTLDSPHKNVNQKKLGTQLSHPPNNIYKSWSPDVEHDISTEMKHHPTMPSFISRIRHDSALSQATDVTSPFDSPSEVSSCVSPNFISNFNHHMLLGSSSFVPNIPESPVSKHCSYVSSLPTTAAGLSGYNMADHKYRVLHEFGDDQSSSLGTYTASALFGSPIESKSKKKLQNKFAAARYRQKKKEEFQYYLDVEKELLDTNRCLKNQLACLSHEFNMLKQILK